MRVFVAMSGGVDSSVAAALLKEQGYEVHGVFMKTWTPAGISCKTHDDRLMAARAAAHLGIPFAVWDFRDGYKKEVVDYMIAEYAAGRTPNPDVMCNKHIKFGLFLACALAQGADYVATGHYIKIQNGNSKFKIIYKLIQADDKNKDQSYFLWTLTQDQLKHCLFPIGDYEKPRVREMARECGLPNWDKKDSQGICFVGQFDFADFLRTIIPPKKGTVLTTAGVKMGEHDGAQFVTIGQRRGLHLSSKYQAVRSNGVTETKAHYVVKKDVITNTIVVAEEGDPLLYRKKIDMSGVHWIFGDPSQLPLRCLARIRYRQPLQTATILYNLPWQDREYQGYCQRFKIIFDQPQKAVAPGQSLVFYTNEGEMLGGGIIA